MQKRRKGHASSGSTLPLVSQDLDSPSRSQAPRRSKRSRKKTSSTSQFPLGVLLLVSLACLMVLTIKHFSSRKQQVIDLLQRSPRSLEVTSRKDHASYKLLPFSQYDALVYPFQHSTLVGLYFAASWCPMSSGPSNLLEQYFSDILLPPPTDEQDEPGIKLLSIVYVSSDTDEDSMLAYQKKNWISVPFDSDERTALKKEFSVCAKREIEELGIERKFEIPTLIIFDGETHGILTTNGVEDIQEHGKAALDHWMNQRRLVHELRNKYRTK